MGKMHTFMLYEQLPVIRLRPKRYALCETSRSLSSPGIGTTCRDFSPRPTCMPSPFPAGLGARVQMTKEGVSMGKETKTQFVSRDHKNKLFQFCTRLPELLAQKGENWIFAKNLISISIPSRRIPTRRQYPRREILS